jgi:hypothetical protein
MLDGGVGCVVVSLLIATFGTVGAAVADADATGAEEEAGGVAAFAR